MLSCFCNACNAWIVHGAFLILKVIWSIKFFYYMINCHDCKFNFLSYTSTWISNLFSTLCPRVWKIFIHGYLGQKLILEIFLRTRRSQIIRKFWLQWNLPSIKFWRRIIILNPLASKPNAKKTSHDHNLLCLQNLVHTVSCSPDVYSFQWRLSNWLCGKTRPSAGWGL